MKIIIVITLFIGYLHFVESRRQVGLINVNVISAKYATNIVKPYSYAAICITNSSLPVQVDWLFFIYLIFAETLLIFTFLILYYVSRFQFQITKYVMQSVQVQ